MRAITAGPALLFLTAVFTACGKNVDTQIRDSVRTLANADLPRADVEVLEVRESGEFTIAEVKVKTALKFKKADGKLILDEVRIGDRRWEKADHILSALQEERARTTRTRLEKIRLAIVDYGRDHGAIPAVESFEALIDLLSPGYLNPPIRLDGWSTPFSYRSHGSSGFDLRSAGPDGEMGNADDIVAAG